MERLIDLGSKDSRRNRDHLQAGRVHLVEIGEVEVLDGDLVVTEIRLPRLSIPNITPFKTSLQPVRPCVVVPSIAIAELTDVVTGDGC